MHYLLLTRDESCANSLAATLGADVAVSCALPGKKFARAGERQFFVRPDQPEDYAALLSAMPALPDRVLYAWPWGTEQTRQDIETQLQWGVQGAFLLTQALMNCKPASPVSVLYVHSRISAEPLALHDAVGAFAKTVAYETRKIAFKVVSFGDDGGSGVVPPMLTYLPQLLHEFEAAAQDAQARYLNGKRQRRVFKQVQRPSGGEDVMPVRNDGVYLVTGGAAGLGYITARHIASQHRVKLVLCGRRPADEQTRKCIEEIEFLGSECVYYSIDVADGTAVQALVDEIRMRMGPINGVIHSAGIIRDALITQKSLGDFRDVLRPKVLGTMNLDIATAQEPLDFLLCFSSIAALLGNMGQADYSYANSFMDHFSQWREQQRAQSKRSGHCLSVNWPLWNDGGMQVNEQVRIFSEKTLGIPPLTMERGLSLLSEALSMGRPQLFAAEGQLRKIGKWFGLEVAHDAIETQALTPHAQHDANAIAVVEVDETPPTGDEEVLAALQRDLVAGVVEILEVDPKDVEIDTDLSRFGFDSITFTTFGNRITEGLKVDITPVVFFEYQTIRELSEHFQKEYRAEIQSWYRRKTGSAGARTPARVPHAAGAGSAGDSRSTMPSPTALPSVRPAPAAPLTVSMSTSPRHEPIAVIGIDGAFPQSADLNIFWKHVAAGADLISEVPSDRWSWQTVYGDPFAEKNRTRIKWGGFVPDIDKFDAEFFGISRREAELMDPQHRLFLQIVWRCIEDAGYRVSVLAKRHKVGLFCGSASIDYHDIMSRNDIDIDVFAVTGSMFSILVNRISYLLDFRGPSEPVETACSSSLVAVHRAMQSIRNGECDVAIAGGIHLMMGPSVHIGLDKGGFLSQEGRCKTFDKSADGYVRGEGAAAMLLKPLNKALADGDHIHAVIRGSAVNHGGHVNTLTTPNPNAQTEVVVEAWKQAQVDPSTITYIETHGTGTALGDPIEIKALKRAFDELYQHAGSPQGTRQKHCGLGTVKTNIGHLEFAAGIAGMTKVIQSMRHTTLPATVHFKELNPYINLDNSPFYIVDNKREWSELRGADGTSVPRRAGVSSFGFGGVNCHVALEEFRRPVHELPRTHPAGIPQAVLLSAKKADRLRVQAQDLIAHLKQAPTAPALEDVAFTLAAGREAMDERLLVIATSIDDLLTKLQSHLADFAVDGVYRGSKKAGKARLAFLKSREDVARFVAERVGREDLVGLADHWVHGLDFDWSGTRYATGGRISLPTYPFAKTRYWIEAPTAATAESHGSLAEDARLADNEAYCNEVLNLLHDGLLTKQQAQALLSAR